MAKKTEKYVHKGFSWNLRGPIDQKAKSFVLAAYGGDNPETCQMLRKQEGGSLIGRSWHFASLWAMSLHPGLLEKQVDGGKTMGGRSFLIGSGSVLTAAFVEKAN